MGLRRYAVAVAVAVAVTAALLPASAWAHDGDDHGDPTPVPTAAAPERTGAGGSSYSEPVVLRPDSAGVLEVRLIAQQGAMDLDTVDRPVRNALLFGYELVRGTSSTGERSGRDLYPAPTLNVDPGQTLIVHLDNRLTGLRIRDYQQPTFTPAGEQVPLYPRQLRNSPYNLHTHGLHVSPTGNSDNVLISIPNGSTNTYRYAIPEDHPEGLYWYHSHLHQLTTPQVYRGLVGMLVIGRADGGIPAVWDNDLPVRTMALQYNYVFDRSGGQAVMNNPFWPANVSTLQRATAEQLADGTYEPKLTPVNFADSAPGTRYMTAWWDGPLSVNNNRGVYQYVPSNLQSFRSRDGSVRIPADPGLPDADRDLQYTVNGQFQPVIAAAPGQTEIWVIGNFTDAAYLRVAVTSTATGERVPIRVVAQDGNPYERVQSALEDDGKALLLPPATRYAIAVTMPQEGGLRLEMPTYEGKLPMTLSNKGIAYTNNGTNQPPAVTGTLRINPEHVSYADGFFVYPTQTLLTMEPAAGEGTTVPFEPGQPLDAYTSFVDLSNTTPDVRRTLEISGGFANENASNEDLNAFAYQFANNQFPNIPLLQPRLNSTEQWNFVNENNDQHPIHIHVNDFQVISYIDPVAGFQLRDLPFGQDNQNTPAPLFNADGSKVLEPGRMSLRTYFRDFIGTYVLHCHRLNHEDNGLMAIINVIPEVTAYAVALRGSGNQPTTVRVYDQATKAEIARVTPFGRTSSDVDVAMGDVDGDMILDLIVGAGEGMAPMVKVYSGAGPNPFTDVLVEREMFARGFRGGVRVASANLDGSQRGENIVVANGPGMRSTVKVLASGPARAQTQRPYSVWNPHGDNRTGVELATGPVDFTGRESVITAPGPGSQPRVRTWSFSLFTSDHDHGGHGTHSSAATRQPDLTAGFLAFGRGFRGGVNLATGWVGGEQGGFSRIIVGQAGGGSRISVFSTGNALNGHPELYVTPLHEHGMASYVRGASFVVRPGSTSGVEVATAADPTSADLVVSTGGRSVEVYRLVRAAPTDTAWTPRLVQTRTVGAAVASLGGR